MSKWKTSQRGKARKFGTNESSGNLSSSFREPGSDSSSLSFLDDMLATGGGGGGGVRAEDSSSSQRLGSGSGSGENIGDILDLVGTTSRDGSSFSRRESSSSEISGLGSTGASNPRRERFKERNREQQQQVPVAPLSPYARNRSPNRARPKVNRYGSGGAGSRPQSRSRGRRSASRDHSRDPPSRVPSDEHRMSLTHAANNHASDRIVELRDQSGNSSTIDQLNPIPVFTVNAGHHDDDSVSQITSSVTSYYNDMDSLRSGSFPWSRGTRSGGGGGGGGSGKAASHGENSYADTLDEIADMLHPNHNQNGRSHSMSKSRSAEFRHSKSLSGGGGNIDDFSRPPSKVDDIFGKQTSSSPNLVAAAAAAAAPPPPLNADEIYRSSKKSSRPSQQSRWKSLGEPLLSQTRLLIRYWISLIFPREWRKKGGKDDEQGYADTWNASPKKVPRSKQRQLFFGTAACYVMAFFVVTTLVILAGRLTFLHGGKFPSSMSAAARVRGALSNRKNKKSKHSKTNLVGKDVHGGMAPRSESGTGASAIVGGMANHAVEVPLPPKEEYVHHDHIGVELPSSFNNFADITELPVRKGVDVPMFWHIPRAAGGSVNDIFGGCLGLTLASDAGASGSAGKENTQKLQKIKFSKHFSYVNVDTSSPEGIERAKKLDLVESELADMVISTLLYQASSLFTKRHRGRLFTIIRHPVERAVSLFHYVQDTQWRRRQTFQKELSELSIQEYFESGLAENNWMTRFLINEPTKGELTREDLHLAKEILRRKCLVGLLAEKGESFARFERYFGFPLKNAEQKDCHEKKLQWAWPLKHRHDEVDENTPLWDLIMTHNMYDMELYHYASEVVFQEQAKIFE